MQDPNFKEIRLRPAVVDGKFCWSLKLRGPFQEFTTPEGFEKALRAGMAEIESETRRWMTKE